MARNEIHIDATPEEVFAVLSDARTYARWVTGTRRVRSADPDWPENGTELHHEVGLPPLSIRDSTSVVASTPPHRLELRARARPLPDALISLRLQPLDGGTWVTMVEDPANPLLRLLTGPVGHAILRLRNAESLRRLKELAEGRRPLPGEPLPAS